MMPAKPKKNAQRHRVGALPTIFILVGIFLLVAVVFLLKNETEPPAELSGQTPEMQLDWYLENQQPVFIFFHSTTCQTCIDMMDIVAQVYPEFDGQVGLVDVNVYEPRNERLLQRARISNIPTQVFVNQKGEGKTLIGAMQPDELRVELRALAGGASNGD